MSREREELLVALREGRWEWCLFPGIRGWECGLVHIMNPLPGCC